MKIDKKGNKVFTNEAYLQGYLYAIPEKDGLRMQQTGEKSKHPGTDYITGCIEIATDDEMTNIISVHYSYVTAYFGDTDKKNNNFDILNGIIDGKYKVATRDTNDKPTMVSIGSSAIGLNEYFIESKETGEDVLVSQQRFEGGFMNIVTQLKPEANYGRDEFVVDMLITNVMDIEANEERNLPEKAKINGYIFDYAGKALPVSFTTAAPNAINYFLGLDASNQNPTFTQLKGSRVSQVVVRKITEDSAFGEASVREVSSRNYAWDIHWAKADPYEWDSEETLTIAAMNEKMTVRETDVATKKNDYLARKAAKEQSSNAFGGSATDNSQFKF